MACCCLLLPPHTVAVLCAVPLSNVEELLLMPGEELLLILLLDFEVRKKAQGTSGRGAAARDNGLLSLSELLLLGRSAAMGNDVN